MSEFQAAEKPSSTIKSGSTPTDHQTSSQIHSAAAPKRKRRRLRKNLEKIKEKFKKKQSKLTSADKFKAPDQNSSIVGQRTVGLLQARSPWLRKDNVYLGIMQKQSELQFYGCVKLRVLAGLIHCNGYIIRPTPTYHTLHSPSTGPALSLSPLDPLLEDEEFDSYLAPFRTKQSLHVHSSTLSKSSKESKCSLPGCIKVDLGVEDTSQVNSVVRKDWGDMTALVLLRAVDDNLPTLLSHWTQPYPVFSVHSQIVDGFKTLTTVEGKKKLHLPPSYMDVAWEVASIDGAKLLVCGSKNSGKSTFCRFLINYMLNRYPRVCYLECDLGQPEFTVPEVLSLHVVTTPILGPPYTHIRKPYKSYYYGDKTPEADPEYYLSILKALYQHYSEGVLSTDPNTPLIINTCGWIQNMGVQLFLDTVRVFTPTHIVRFLLSSKINLQEDLPPLTSEFLNLAPGLFKMSDITPFTEGAVAPDNQTNDITMYASSDEVLSVNEESSKESSSSDEDEKVADKMDQSNCSTDSLSDRPIKRKRLKLSGVSYSVTRGENLSDGTTINIKKYINQGWIQSPPYSVRYLESLAKHSGSKDSKAIRRLMYISYFSGLFPLASEVARQHNLPDPYGNMFRFAPPLEIPWKDVAVHIIHRNVLRSQSLYAINGKIVALGRVDSKEIADKGGEESHDLPMFLRSETPLIEFIGLGVVRGVDMERKSFYIATPECTLAHSLARINTIALGNPDTLDMRTIQNEFTDQPYMVKGFQSLLGMFSWKLS